MRIRLRKPRIYSKQFIINTRNEDGIGIAKIILR